MRPVVVTSAIAAFVAAVAFAFSCADTSGLAGAKDGADGGDAATVEDAASLPDAVSDASPDAGSGFCATHPGHTFCDDFDDGDLAARWSSVFGVRGAPLRDDAGATSPPFALLATAAATTSAAGDFHASSVLKVFSATTHLHLSANVLALQPLAGLNTVYIRPSPLPGNALFYEVSIWTPPNGTSTLEHYVFYPDGGGPKTNQPFTESWAGWRHVELDVRFDTAVATLTIDGVQRGTVALEAVQPTAVEVELGIPYADPVDAGKSVRWDDVTIDAE